MPVMLGNNDATECCMTKGAEGTIVNWQSIKGTEGQNVLDTLFVKLKNPPKSIQIEGLPENVVPVTRHITSTICVLPNDETISISRDQALVLPNFAMTDYVSQGRTRSDNPVDLSNCKNHQSYYTCLSRSASAAGTIIIQGFDANKIIGGASGYLRQEFRELELLDEITKLQYNKLLPDDIYSTQCNVIIQQFQAWKGTSYIPKNVHPAICSDFMFMRNAVISPWQIIKNTKAKSEAFKPSKSNLLNFVAAQVVLHKEVFLLPLIQLQYKIIIKGNNQLHLKLQYFAKQKNKKLTTILPMSKCNQTFNSTIKNILLNHLNKLITQIQTKNSSLTIHIILL
jgi:hypothetical protein